MNSEEQERLYQQEITSLEDRMLLNEDRKAYCERAKQIYEDSIFQDAMGSLDNELFKVWKGGRELTPQQRENAWLMGQMVSKVKGYIKHVMSGEVILGQEIERDLKDLEFKRGMLGKFKNYMRG